MGQMHTPANVEIETSIITDSTSLDITLVPC